MFYTEKYCAGNFPVIYSLPVEQPQLKIMSTKVKTVKLEERVHTRVRKLARKDGRLVGPLVTELVAEAMDARIEAAKLKTDDQS